MLLGIIKREGVGRLIEANQRDSALIIAKAQIDVLKSTPTAAGDCPRQRELFALPGADRAFARAECEGANRLLHDAQRVVGIRPAGGDAHKISPSRQQLQLQWIGNVRDVGGVCQHFAAVDEKIVVGIANHLHKHGPAGTAQAGLDLHRSGDCELVEIISIDSADKIRGGEAAG